MRSPCPNEKRSYKRFFQLSIRASLVLVVIAALLSNHIRLSLQAREREVRLAHRLQQLGAMISWTEREPHGFDRCILRFDRDHLKAIGRIRLHSSQVWSRRTSPAYLTQQDVEEIASLKHLKYLGLGGITAVVTDDMLQTLSRNTSLRELSVSGNRFTGAGARAFVSHPSIARFIVGNINVSNEDYRAVLESLPKFTGDVESHVFGRVRNAYVSSQKASVARVTNGEIVHSWFFGDMGSDDQALTALLDGLDSPIEIRLNESRLNADLIEMLRSLKDLRHLKVTGPTGFVNRPAPVPGVLSMISSLTQLEALSYAYVDSVGNLDALSPLKSLHELNLEALTIRDEDLAQLPKLPKLKKLRLPNASITSRGIQILKDCGFQFEYLELPDSFRDMKQAIVESGLASHVECLGSTYHDPSQFGELFPVDTNAPRSDQEIIDRITKHVSFIDGMLEHSVFPRSKGSPKRPEDYLIYSRLERCNALASMCLKVGDMQGVMKWSREVLSNNSLSVTPVDCIIDDPAGWKQFVLGAEGYSERFEAARALSSLMSLRFAEGAFEEALELLARVVHSRAIVYSMTAAELELGVWLCQHCNPEMYPIRNTLCMIAKDQSSTRFEKPTSLPWDQSNGICIIAPPGKKLVRISAERGRLPGAPLPRHKGSMLMPENATSAFVQAESFPIVVELE